jgi:hypothetical protein
LSLSLFTLLRPFVLIAAMFAVSGCMSLRNSEPAFRLDAMPEGVRSPHSPTPAGLLIHNRSSKDLEVYWIDFDGDRRPQTKVAAGESGVIGARVGHAFVIEHAGKFLRLAFANFPTEELTLTDADFAWPIKHRELQIEGWPVHLDKELSAEEANAAQAFLQGELAKITRLIPTKHLPALQAIPLWVDKDVADRGQYHPGFYWMEGSGWHIEKYKAIHFGDLQRLLSYPRHQPMVVLHELSHGFHDQVLGFDHKGIEKAYLHARKAGLYEEVEHVNGRDVHAYAMTNEREYFAELTEAYFGVNDYFPFTRDELRSHDPLGYRMIESVWGVKTVAGPYSVGGLSKAEAEEYELDKSFFKKALTVQDILIVSSARVSDYTLYEAAYQFDNMIRNLDSAVAQRIRDKKVLCILAAHDELTSDIPQFKTDKVGKELDYYNWRKRGFLTRQKGRQIVFFAEEDVLEYEGGMQDESILIHEFAHVIHGAGFDKALQDRLTATYKNAKEAGLWNDGYASQRFRRVESETPVSLLDALARHFPEQPRDFLATCLDAGDILVNGEAARADVQVTKADKVRIVFGGPKSCYAALNRSEYWAEIVQCWYDTNRTMDHDHNHIHTREQLKEYDPLAAEMCEDLLGNSSWRFVTPRERAGTGHLTGYDPATSPTREELPHIRSAALDYYDEYWKEYWSRLRAKHGYE